MERNHISMKCPADYTDAMQSDSDSVNSNYLCDIKGEPIDPEIFVHTGSLENKTLDHIKAECINECCLDIKVEEHSIVKEEFYLKYKDSCLIRDNEEYPSNNHVIDVKDEKILNIHISTHIVENNQNICTYNSCSKNFNQNSQLVNHLKTHIREKIIHVITVRRHLFSGRA